MVVLIQAGWSLIEAGASIRGNTEISIQSIQCFKRRSAVQAGTREPSSTSPPIFRAMEC